MRKKAWMKSLAWVLLAGYGSCILYWMFLGFRRSSLHVTGLRYNIIPLKTILHFMTTAGSHNWMFPVINLAGNIGVFVPFGLLLPFLFKKARSYMGFSVIFGGAILLLELLQMILRVGTADVDDLILNEIGGLIGLWVFHRFHSLLPADRTSVKPSG